MTDFVKEEVGTLKGAQGRSAGLVEWLDPQPVSTCCKNKRCSDDSSLGRTIDCSRITLCGKEIRWLPTGSRRLEKGN